MLGTLALSFLLAATPPGAAPKRRPVGLVQRLEVTSLTRERIALWVRVALAHVPRGSRESFTGKLDIANVAIPFHAPARVMLQPAAGGTGAGSDAVFFLDVDLAAVPDALLARVNPHAVDLTLDGTLTAENGATDPVFAVGVLRFGTPDVKTPTTANPQFVRFGGAHLTDVSLSETSGEGSVVLYNPFSFAVPVREVVYQLVVGDRVLASGEKKAMRLRPRQENPVDLPISAKNVDLAAAAGSALMAGGVVEGRLVGHVTVKLSTGDLTVPINLPGRVEVGR